MLHGIPERLGHLFQDGGGAARPRGIEEQIVVKIGGEPVVQRAVHAEIDHPRQGGRRRAQQHDPALGQRLPPALPAQGHDQHGRAPGEEKAQHGIFDPEHASAQHACGKGPAKAQRTALHARLHQPVETDGQQRHAPLLGAVARHVTHRGVGRRAQKGQRPQAGPAGAEQAQQFVTRRQEHGGRAYLHQPHAQKAVPLHKAGRGVQPQKQRAFLLIHIPVEHLTRGHAFAHGEKALGVHPAVQRIERRALGDHTHQQHRGEQDEERRQQPGPVFLKGVCVHDSRLLAKQYTIFLPNSQLSFHSVVYLTISYAKKH